MREDQPLSPDSLTQRDGAGVALDADWIWYDLPTVGSFAHASAEATNDARTSTRRSVHIELGATGRMRLVLVGHGYPLADGTELRSRVDRSGHVLVWPSQDQYRVASPSSLRALFGDRRLDVGPLFEATPTPARPGRALGYTLEGLTTTTPFGELTLESTTETAAGSGAVLLCRLLTELLGVDPASPVCAETALPLKAQFRFARGGRLGFVVTQVAKRVDSTTTTLLVPPDTAEFRRDGLPLVPGGSIPKAMLAALRTRAPATSVAAAADAPKQGLVAVNHATSLRALLIDGIPVSWLGAGEERSLAELKNGIYSVAWRDFFGDYVEPAHDLNLPARVRLAGPADAESN